MKLVPQVLRALVSAPAQAVAAELTSPRFPLRIAAEMSLMSADRKPGERTACAVLDLSQSGVALSTRTLLPGGAAFVLWMKDAEQNVVAIECVAMRVQDLETRPGTKLIAARFEQMAPVQGIEQLPEESIIAAIRSAILS